MLIVWVDLRSVLIDAFDRDQQDRYDMYRRVKLKKETVRKVLLLHTFPVTKPPSRSSLFTLLGQTTHHHPNIH